MTVKGRPRVAAAPAAPASEAESVDKTDKESTATKKDRAWGSEGWKKRKHPLHYSGFLFKVLKQVHPDLGISKRGMNIMNSFMNDIFDRIATESTRLLRIMARRTLSVREVQTSVRLLLPGELAKHAVSEGTKSCSKFFNQENPDDPHKKGPGMKGPPFMKG
eukprot:Skav204211  [mRNA]  locus=scaffold985:409689:426701:- [translate_table: standard]